MLADSVLRDLGIPSPQSKVVRLYQEDGKTLTPEGSAIIDQLNKQLKKDYPNSTRSDMDYWLEAKNNPREIVVSNELPGNTIGLFLQSASDQEKLKLFKSQNFQKDLGVLIGADAFLGNSDRVSYRPSVKFNGQPSRGWFHPGNFLLGAKDRIHSLDNEALFPSKRAQGDGGLQTLLDGGELKINAKDFDPSVEQPHYPSLQMFANPNSVKEAVRTALGKLAEPDETGHKPVNFSDQDLDEIVNGIAPHVTDTIKQLSEASKEGKLRGGPLNERVKTEADKLTNNDGLVYDQFKIRSRFAGMVANQNPASSTTAQQYSEYRDWKNQIQKMQRDPGLPDKPPLPPENIGIPKIAARKVVGLVDQSIKTGRTARDLVRQDDVSDDSLRSIINNQAMQRDRSGKRAVFEATCELLSRDMGRHADLITQGFQRATDESHPNVANNYKKTLQKSVKGLLEQYQPLVNGIVGATPSDPLSKKVQDKFNRLQSTISQIQEME